MNSPPTRILIVLPCCIGDVVLATAALMALRRAYPSAHIAWAVGGWSKGVLEGHPALDTIVDTGPAALPTRSLGGLLRFVGQMRVGRYDLLISLVRSPTMSVAALLSGIPMRAGIDSGGRGFGYTLRAPVEPQIARHEAEIYLDVVRALGVDTSGCRAFVPVPDSERDFPARHGLTRPYLVVNPAGGRNPGMTMDSKRYPPAQMAALAERLAAHLDAQIVLLGGPKDGDILAAFAAALGAAPAAVFSGGLRFGQIAGLAVGARLYLGNDTGLTHLAAAAGAKTVMIMGPSDPARYAPYAADAIAVWQPTRVSSRGVAAGTPLDFDWARDGISVEAAQTQIIEWLGAG